MADMKFLAKSKKANQQTVLLQKHIQDVVAAVEHLRTDKYADDWWQALKTAALLHDVGKIDPSFQTAVGNAGEQEADACPLSHNLLALFLLNVQRLKETFPSYKTAVLSAIVFHHWRSYYVELLAGSRMEEVQKKAGAILQDRVKWCSWLEELKKLMRGCAEAHGLDLELIQFNEVLLQYIRYNGILASGAVVPPYTLALLPLRLQEQGDQEQERFRVFVTGNLMRCDHFASLVETGGTTGRLKNPLQLSDIEDRRFPPYEDLGRLLLERLQRKQPGAGLWQKDFLDTQSDCRAAHMILVAPTGAGKTEFACLWGAGWKNVFLLPMQAAVNSIYQRINEMLQGLDPSQTDACALLHGNAGIERLQYAKKNRELAQDKMAGQASTNQQPVLAEEDIEGEVNRFTAMAKHFSSPYIVATADQIAPAALRYAGYERTYAVLMDSVVILDEVQAYDPKAAAIITFLLQSIAFLGGRVLLMTATLPGFIRKEIEERFRALGQPLVVAGGKEVCGASSKQGELSYVSIDALQKLQQFPLHTCVFQTYDHSWQEYDDKRKSDSTLSRLVEEMLKKVQDGKKVLAIFNTVHAAQTVYSIAKEKARQEQEVFLLHSRFTVKDRKQLEKLITKEKLPNVPGNKNQPGAGCLVISTQIVEASLDIDADLLYTELCPADSLFQRMGRIYRRFVHTGCPDNPVPLNVVILLNAAAKFRGQLTSSSRVYPLDALEITFKELQAAAQGTKQAMAAKPPAVSKEQKQVKRKESDIVKEILAACEVTQSFFLDGTEKNEIVDKVYGQLEDSAYFQTYKETLDMLDYGYCTTKMAEAQKLFRDVSNIDIIPDSEDSWQAFCSDVEKYLEDHAPDRAIPSINYWTFRDEVLDRRVVSAAYRLVEKNLSYDKDVWEKLQEDVCIPERVQSQIERWLAPIRLAQVQYDYNEDKKSGRGLIVEKSKDIEVQYGASIL